MLRWFLYPFLLLMLLQLPSSAEREREVLGGRAVMQATPLAFDPADPAQRKTGALVYLGGVELSSPDRAFGGFSAMHVAGDRFTLVSDTGNVVQFRLGGDWKIRDAAFSNVVDGPATGREKGSRDIESMVADPEGRHFWLGFENHNEIWRYTPGLTHAEAHAAPPVMADWSINGGPESLVRLRDGSFIVISETSRLGGRDTRAVVRFLGDPADSRTHSYAFAYVPPAGFDPSDALQLPDGRLLILNRRVNLGELPALRFGNLFTSKLTLIDIRGARPGTKLAGQEIATIDAPFPHDNFEALAITRERDATILWVASDNNLAWYQRSLLMKFRLELP